jgi:serine/threonine protein kinase
MYASPEIFLGTLSRHSDQYSLAIVYQEMLTGTLPFTGKNSRQLLLQHTKGMPNLDRLPARDKIVVAKALTKDPEKRFGSCMEFVNALLTRSVLAGASARAKKGPKGHADSSGQKATAPSADTDTVLQKQDTDSAHPGAQAPVKLLPGYRFLECLSRSPLADQWRVESPNGKRRLAKVLYGFVTGERLKNAMVRLIAIHHPLLAECKAVASDSGRLVILSNLVDKTLRDRALEGQARHLPGIMRDELLQYLRSAAEALDYLFDQHSIQHLGLNPRNLGLLDDGRPQIAEFGLAQLLWLPTRQPIAQRNARYAPPELFADQVNRSSDQYSLALIYYELLTGGHPFHGPAVTSGSARLKARPDLERLPDPDRPIIARALDPDPAKRWPSCSALVTALDSIHDDSKPAAGDHAAALAPAPRTLPTGPIPEDTQVSLNQIIAEAMASVGGDLQLANNPVDAPVLSEKGDLLRHSFQVGLPLGTARVKLDAFWQQWYGLLVCEDDQGCAFQVSIPTNFWRRWLGGQPGLEIHVRLARAYPLSATPIEVSVQIRAFRCNAKRASQILQEMGPPLLDSLRTHLLVNSEKRTQDRLLWPHRLKVRPIFSDGSQGDPLECAGKDISHGGIAFYLPHELDTSDVLITLPSSAHPPEISVPATLVRATRCPDGWYEVGALFRLTSLCKSLPEVTPIPVGLPTPE